MYTALPFFKALADETRMRLLYILWQHELNVNELVLILQMGQSRISRHLKILSTAGLLVSRRDGLWVFYSAPTDGYSFDFLQALMPFLMTDEAFLADKAMAESLLEERASKNQQFFNAIAEDWNKLSREVLGTFDLASHIGSLMPKCKVATDLGCGTGNVLSMLLKKADTVIGVDGSPRMLELARRHLETAHDRISLRIGDMAHLPLRDGEADFVCLNMVLHHIVSPLDALFEVRRVLQNRGTFVLTDFNRHDDEYMRNEYGDRWLGFSLETLADLLSRAGFFIKVKKCITIERGLSLHSIVSEPI